jgi:4-hydroxymandelate oxidase
MGTDVQLLTTLDYERSWKAGADQAIWEYVAGGAGASRTVRANIEAFGRIWLQPRGLRKSHAELNAGTSLLGHDISLPILLAPTSPQRLLHPDAELATTRAARSAGVATIVSTDSHYPFPDIAAEAPGRCWFQLYGYRSMADVEAALDLAERSGATAIVVTVDALFAARRISARRAGFRLPGNVDYGTLRMLGILTGEAPASGRLDRLPFTWDDLLWIRESTALPVLIKGLLRPIDVARCVDVGADGVIVSNHGGRQLDGVIPSLVALNNIVQAVPAGLTILFDGGIRSGVDVAKALALGAHGVCVGRPYLWGLGLAGQTGVEQVLGLLRAELEDAMLQLGVSSIGELDRELLIEYPERLVDPLGGSIPHTR